MKLLFTSPFIMHRLVFVSLLTLLALASSVKAAEKPVRYYDIETIIFESLDPAARQSENWAAEVKRQVPPVAVELDQPYPGTMPAQYNPKLTFKTLPESEFRLQTTEKLLVDSHQYRILLHTAWVQPGMGPEAALPVHITRSFLTQTPVVHSLIPATPGAPPADLPQPTTETPTRSVLDGYIKIILTRYLHAEVDLLYTTGLPVNPQNPQAAVASPGTNTTAVNGTTLTTENPAGATTVNNSPASASSDASLALPAPVVYQLKQSRRMRSKVLHYLDHPVLGMLLLITPHKVDAGTPAHG
jgi:hypothetical protein